MISEPLGRRSPASGRAWPARPFGGRALAVQRELDHQLAGGVVEAARRVVAARGLPPSAATNTLMWSSNEALTKSASDSSVKVMRRKCGVSCSTCGHGQVAALEFVADAFDAAQGGGAVHAAVSGNRCERPIQNG